MLPKHCMMVWGWAYRTAPVVQNERHSGLKQLGSASATCRDLQIKNSTYAAGTQAQVEKLCQGQLNCAKVHNRKAEYRQVYSPEFCLSSSE
jgi:hypothetical protein